MKSICLSSPAKLNLTLRVINKRPDGYHNLSTLFEKINLCDDIHFTSTLNGRIRIFCDHSAVPTGPKNLVYQVAADLKKNFGVPYGADIKIKKRIPVAAGLAGGSSNAATAIFGLNKIWELSLSFDKMIACDQRMGCDVPLFIYNYNYAHGTRRGDRIQRVFLDKKIWHFLVVPRFKVYSREVFRAFKMKLTKQSDNVNILSQMLKKKSVVKVSALLCNDLQPTILRIHPKLLQIKKNIEKIIGKPVIFSGSGPSLFGLAESEHKAKEICSHLKKHYQQVFAVRTL